MVPPVLFLVIVVVLMLVDMMRIESEELTRLPAIANPYCVRLRN